MVILAHRDFRRHAARNRRTMMNVFATGFLNRANSICNTSGSTLFLSASTGLLA